MGIFVHTMSFGIGWHTTGNSIHPAVPSAGGSAEMLVFHGISTLIWYRAATRPNQPPNASS
jgi:hypothetical protein